MGRKTLANVHCLLDLIEKAPVSLLKTFSNLAECQSLAKGFDWSEDEANLCGNLLEHIKHLRKEQRDCAEREALRIMRLTSPRGSAILSTVADQLNDSDLQNEFLAQHGGEIGRAIWMRTHSDDTARLFDVAESILNTNDIRGNKHLYDSFDVPCDDDPPPFIWNDRVKKELETQLTKAMQLAEPCELVYVPMLDPEINGIGKTVHFLVVRFAGDQVSAIQMVNRNRKSFFYFPARDATLVYSGHRKVVEVYASTLSTRAPLADVLSKHGFKMPLSNRPLNRSRYDLSPFARPLKDVKPQIDGAKVERLYLTEAKALLHHATDAVTLHIDSGVDLQDVIGGRWSGHPFSEPSAILGVTLVAELILEGDVVETPLSIVLAEPGRCSLQGERDPRMRRIGTQLLETLGVLKPLHAGSGIDDPSFIKEVARLLEYATNPMDGFALAHLNINIDRFADEGILIEADRITEKVVESAEAERFQVKLERCVDPNQVHYVDPLTGNDIILPDKHARRWKVDLNWLQEEIITALGTSLRGLRVKCLDDEPVLLGEIDIDGHPVALYFASKLSDARRYAKVDAALRLQSRTVPGIVLTTAAVSFSFAATNIIIAIEDVLAMDASGSVIDLARLKVAYRHGQLAAMGGTSVRLNVSSDGQSAVLQIPGKAPWRITGAGKIPVLQRLVDAFNAGTPHVNTKILMADTNCTSPANLFSKKSPWREYLARVKGARAWQLNLLISDEPVDDDELTVATEVNELAT